MRKMFLVVLFASVLGCTKETMPTAVGPTQPTATVSITPSSPTVSACGGTQQFSAVYTGMTDSGTNWSVQEPGGGTITVSGLYSAPCTAGTYHVRAASATNPQVTATATVTVGQSFTITVSPATAAVNSCLTQQFTASYSGTSDTRTTWSVQEGAAGGSVTTSGLYTAPNAAGTYHVVGTSVLDPLRTSVATVTVTDKVLSVAVSPPSITVQPNSVTQFTATVTTTCGSQVAQSGLLAMSADKKLSELTMTGLEDGVAIQGANYYHEVKADGNTYPLSGPNGEPYSVRVTKALNWPWSKTKYNVELIKAK